MRDWAVTTMAALFIVVGIGYAKISGTKNERRF